MGLHVCVVVFRGILKFLSWRLGDGCAVTILSCPPGPQRGKGGEGISLFNRLGSRCLAHANITCSVSLFFFFLSLTYLLSFTAIASPSFHGSAWMPPLSLARGSVSDCSSSHIRYSSVCAPHVSLSLPLSLSADNVLTPVVHRYVSPFVCTLRTH